jgi:ESS family glutamate:Na+ symporter
MMTDISQYLIIHNLQSVLILLLIFVVAYTIARTSILRRLYLPVAMVAGIIILLIGPQAFGRFDPNWGVLVSDFYQTWGVLPGVLINIVFACLFLGQPILKLKQMWQLAGRQVVFGQTMAWGQYVVGGLVTLLILIPFFGSLPITASLLEIAFEGGHGTVAGLTPLLNDYGFSQGRDMANGLATLSLISALIGGVVLIHWGHRRGHVIKEQNIFHRARDKFYHYTIIHKIHEKAEEMQDRHMTVGKMLRQVILIAISVGIGFAIQAILIAIENVTWGQAGVKIFGYVPSFSLCIFGGIIVNHLCQRFKIHISMTANSVVATLSLGVLIMTAIGTMSLEFFTDPNLAIPFVILFITGTTWILFMTLFMARRIFVRHWFTNAIISFGQAMGMTATGLLFAQMVDPKNRTNAVDAFGYKQMMFEPLMGGGLVTAMAIPLIVLFGLPLFTTICAVIMVGWLFVGKFVLKH